MTDPFEAELAANESRPREVRVALYNHVVRLAAKHLLHDLPADPACCPQLLRADETYANNYNPNAIATPELRLLEQSIEADGVTMCVVVFRSPDGSHEVVDGFHRRLVSIKLGREYIPCSKIDSQRGDRMASTVRHNRARGKHQVELMGELVKSMIGLGWSDARIAESLGMSEEESLRLRQVVGVAQQLAGKEYNQAWRGRDGTPDISDG